MTGKTAPSALNTTIEALALRARPSKVGHQLFEDTLIVDWCLRKFAYGHSIGSKFRGRRDK